MSIYRKLYFLGFGIYVFSLFLPAIPIFNAPVNVIVVAFVAFGSLFTFNGIMDYISFVFANLSNLLTVLVFILQFKISFEKLYIFQLAALLSALWWSAFLLINSKDLSNFFIGYWNWLFGIFFILIVMIASVKDQKRLMMISQQPARADAGSNAAI